MSMANDYSRVVNKIERRLGLTPLVPHLPKELNKEAWVDLIKTDTMETFSRYFPRKIKFVADENTCHIRKDPQNNALEFIIKDEYLGGMKLLGCYDIDWSDTSTNNIGISTNSYGFYVPNFGGLEATYEAFLANQSSANIASLYNNNIFVDFEYPNKLKFSRAGNINIELRSYAVWLLVEHDNLQTISPTKMETFEALAQADIANMLYMNLKYYDGLDTMYVNIDLKLSELEQESNKRDNIIESLKDSFVSMSNDALPAIFTVSG